MERDEGGGGEGISVHFQGGLSVANLKKKIKQWMKKKLQMEG